jgi:hypothetical protein
MRKFIVTLLIFSVVLMIWAIIGMRNPDENLFLPSTVLDRSTPLDVNIDIEFIKSLKSPAYGK